MPKRRRQLAPKITALTYSNGKPFISGVELIAGTACTVTAAVNSDTKSVKWKRDGVVVKTDSGAPFDSNWTPILVGAHTLSVTPYSATGATGTAGPTVTVNWTVKSVVPPPPPPVTVSAFVNWQQVANATGYRIFWGTTSRNYPYSLDAGTNLQLEVPNLTKGTVYFFTGRSYNASETSPYGNEAQFTP